MADVHARNGSVWLSPRTTHSSLQSIGSGARQHLVDSDDMVGMGSDAEVEPFFSCDLHQISRGQQGQQLNLKASDCLLLVCADSSCL